MGNNITTKETKTIILHTRNLKKGTNKKRFFVMIIRACWEFILMSCSRRSWFKSLSWEREDDIDCLEHKGDMSSFWPFGLFGAKSLILAKPFRCTKIFSYFLLF